MLVLGVPEVGSGCWEAKLWTWVCKGVGETPGAGASGRLDGGCWVFPGRVPAEEKLKVAGTGCLAYLDSIWPICLCGFHITTPIIS